MTKKPLKHSRKNTAGKVFLLRALSKLGVATRGQTLILLQENKIKVNGHIRNNPKFLVNPDKDKIEVEGKIVKKISRIVYMLHKPRGFITSSKDEKDRKTVFSLLNVPYQLHTVGRLDMATSGLLLLTNDSKLSSWLTDPAQKIPRVYLVSVQGKLEDVALLKTGIKDENEILKAEEVLIRKISNKETHLTVTLLQGKNREIRRLFEHLGHEVIKLKRVSYGNLELKDLELGKYREISERELKEVFPKFYVKFP